MTNIEKNSFYLNAAKTDVRACLKLIGSQYQQLDEALFKIAQEEILTDRPENETSLLKDKELLLKYASEINCENLDDLSAKVDFLKKVLHMETFEIDSLPEDMLMRSILKDVQYQASVA